MDNGTAKTGALPEAPGLRREGALEIAQQVKGTGWLAGLRRAATWVAERELWLLAMVVTILLLANTLPLSLVGASALLLPIPWLCRWVAKGYLSRPTQLVGRLTRALPFYRVSRILTGDSRQDILH